MNQTDALPKLSRLQLAGGAMFVIGVVACVLLLGTSGIKSFFQVYLMAYLFWFGLGMGSLALLMIHHLTGGRWGFIVRRLLEGGAMTLPLMALLFVPILLGMGDLYKWVDPAYVAGDPILEHKEVYLNPPAYTIRTIIYFIIWVGGAVLLYKWSGDQDKAPDGDFKPAMRMRYLSGAGMVLYVITMTMASVDWAMSIEPHFFSTMYGVLFMVGQGLSTFAFLLLVLVFMRSTQPLSEVVVPARVHDVGKLMLAFTILWTYINYGQFVIIWSGNLPEFTPWYIHRSESGWLVVSVVMLLFQFAVPFFVLLSRPLKRALSGVSIVAALVFVMQMVYIFWLIAPDFYTSGFDASTLLPYIGALLVVGGLWLAVFAQVLKQRPLLPLNDMRNDPRARKGHAHA